MERRWNWCRISSSCSSLRPGAMSSHRSKNNIIIHFKKSIRNEPTFSRGSILHIRVLRLQNIDYSMVVLVLHSNFAMTGCHATSICWSVALSPWHQGITTVSMPVRECPHHAPARYPAFSHTGVCIVENKCVVAWFDGVVWQLCDVCTHNCLSGWWVRPLGVVWPLISSKAPR